MIKNKIKNDYSIVILIFLGLFGFARGLFSNYRELWMASNNISAVSIGRIISLASIITVLSFFFFTLKVPFKKLKDGITICLLMKMITSTLLICLNGHNNYFLIKFLIFFDISFEEIILGSIYPLIMQVAKNDIIYTKKNVIESVSGKLGFLLASFLLSKTIGTYLIDYNTCLLLSIVFIFFSFITFLNIKVSNTSTNNYNDLGNMISYLKKNKVLIYFLFVGGLGSVVWSSIIGMRMLSLTKIIGIEINIASYLTLSLGIISNILAILIVKYFRAKNDHINLFFKYGFRVILYFLIFLTDSKIALLVTFIYMLITDMTYSFIFSSHFIHQIKDEYSLIFSTIKYCTNLIGTSIGVFICGITFNYPIKYIGLVTFVLALIHYILATILVNKKKQKLN